MTAFQGEIMEEWTAQAQPQDTLGPSLTIAVARARTHTPIRADDWLGATVGGTALASLSPGQPAPKKKTNRHTHTHTFFHLTYHTIHPAPALPHCIRPIILCCTHKLEGQNQLP